MTRLYRRRGLSVSIAFPGTLGVATDKGVQNNYPLVLDAPTESKSVMIDRYETGALSTDAPNPEEDAE